MESNKSLKIGLLTFHDGINYGGFFQMYSTYTFFKEKGYDIEVINYKNIKHHINEKRYLYTSNLKGLGTTLAKESKFKKCLNNLKITKRVYSLDEGFVAKYDAIIVGADIVWNYEWKFLGSIKAYVLDNIKHPNIISFVPSCGFVDLKNSIPNYFVNGVKNFKQISVRDELTQSVIEQSLGYKPEILLDPTFIINYDSIKLPKLKERNEKKYILIYSFINNTLQSNEIIKHAKINNLEIIAVGYKIDWADRNLNDIGPFEWLEFFKNANFIYTSTFHGTLFALHYKKNFCTLNNPKIEKKIKNVIEITKLNRRILNDKSQIKNLFQEDINYLEVSKYLEPEILKTKSFLNKIFQ
jgi:hypothetical protein